MTQTGGFAFLIAWTLFGLLCLALAYVVLRPVGGPSTGERRHSGEPGSGEPGSGEHGADTADGDSGR
jgi:hypothetical protein